jgi:hypothetical protein
VATAVTAVFGISDIRGELPDTWTADAWGQGLGNSGNPRLSQGDLPGFKMQGVDLDMPGGQGTLSIRTADGDLFVTSLVKGHGDKNFSARIAVHTDGVLNQLLSSLQRARAQADAGLDKPLVAEIDRLTVLLSRRAPG